jgi:BirA family biotin operon repressor/biotin-[acetyl-CoA-carboxylase] ligase
LKWPNDVLVGNCKLGGILIELRAEAAGPACVVVGIGLNVALGSDLVETIAATGLQAADLVGVTGKPVSRNALAGQLIENTMQGLLQFERDGLKAFVDEWSEADALRGLALDVIVGNEVVRGLGRGIDLSGALLVETPRGVQKFLSGEVTVRPTQ